MRTHNPRRQQKGLRIGDLESNKALGRFRAFLVDPYPKTLAQLAEQLQEMCRRGSCPCVRSHEWSRDTARLVARRAVRVPCVHKTRGGTPSQGRFVDMTRFDPNGFHRHPGAIISPHLTRAEMWSKISTNRPTEFNEQEATSCPSR